MASDADAKLLAELRGRLARATGDQLRSITLATLDEMIDLLRTLTGGRIEIESAAAVSAELHKRRGAVEAVRAPAVGNA